VDRKVDQVADLPAPFRGAPRIPIALTMNPCPALNPFHLKHCFGQAWTFERQLRCGFFDPFKVIPRGLDILTQIDGARLESLTFAERNKLLNSFVCYCDVQQYFSR
jgi:hypothetical protein